MFLRAWHSAPPEPPPRLLRRGHHLRARQHLHAGRPEGFEGFCGAGFGLPTERWRRRRPPPPPKQQKKGQASHVTPPLPAKQKIQKREHRSCDPPTHKKGKRRRKPGPLLCQLLGVTELRGQGFHDEAAFCARTPCPFFFCWFQPLVCLFMASSPGGVTSTP